MAINTKEFPNKIKPGLYANKSYERFYYSFKYDNERYRGIIDYSDKTWDKRTKTDNAEKAIFKLKEQKKDNISENATIDDIVQLYFESMKEGTYKQNRKSYYDRKVKPKIGKKLAKSVFQRHLQKLVNENIANGDSPRTAKQIIEVLSPAFNLAEANQITTHNPCRKVKIAMSSSKKIVVNASDRLRVIYNAIMKLYKDDPYYRAFFLLALQGRRKSEVMNLKWEHISFDHDYYVLPTTKNGEEQKIYLPPNVKECLEDFKKNVGWVFESPVNPGHRLCDAKKQTAKLKKAIGEWFTMHYTRNVMVSAMAEQGIDAIYMSGALGHSDPNTVTKYLTMNYLKGSKMASDMIQ